MKLNRDFGVRRAAKRIANRLQHQAVILLYHRIAEGETDPWQLCVTPAHFAEHLEVVRKYFGIFQLQEVPALLEKRRLPRKAAIITFDDGYADNLHHAKPILERYDTPATIFIATGYLGHTREYWWDELDKIFLQPGTLPETLQLKVSGNVHEWRLGDAAEYSDAAFQEQRHWKAYENIGDNPRHFIYRSLWELMQPLPADERQRLCDELISWSGCDPAPRSTHRSLSRDEVWLLAQGGVVKIGSHTVTHPNLSTLAPACQDREIRQSKAYLEEVLERSVETFSYPYGRSRDYTAQTVSLVREAGFRCACSTSANSVTGNADRFQLPRYHVADCNGEVFHKQLQAWLWE